ncbi:MAG: type II secretion system secretin GspD [Bacteriovoracales bacterium]|nr:type II secretion system secretin GspD [Bacteriovoracales bacterium]
MKKSYLNAILLLLFVGLTHFTPTKTYAQFQKYKAKTKFQKNTPPPLPSQTKPSLGQGKDFFGRGTGIKGITKTKEQDKYVNLNPETAFGPEVVTNFNFSNTSLLDLTKHMQKLTGINLIWSTDIKGKITIKAPTPITVGEAWKAYLSALNFNGLTLVKSGGFYRITQAKEVRSAPFKIYTGSFIPEIDNYMMKIIPIKNIESSEIQKNFRNFVGRNGRITNIKQTNTIIVFDTGSNIKRLMKLISFLDVPGHEDSLHILPVKHSSAQEIAKLLDNILKARSSTNRFRSSKSPSQKASNISKIIAESRTNSIIALANAQGIKQLKDLISKLDVKFGAQSADKIHVYYLNYGSAKELSKTLSSLVGQTQRSSSRRTSTSPLTRRSRFNQDNINSSLFSADIKITADEPNNALVVTASPTDWLTIEQVIKKLDIPRDQVYVEGMIMETKIARNKSIGVSIVGAYGTGAGQKAGFVPDGGIIDLITNNITDLGGLFVGAGSGQNVTLKFGEREFTVDSVTGLIKAIATDTNTNVLATPQLLALDNEEGEFEVGESIPIPRVSTANNITTSSTETQDVTLKIKIKPQINKVTRFIKLKIDQDIRDFSTREIKTEQGVVTTTRRTVTTVVVRDRDTIAMGGLMRDQVSDTEKKVPLLGDIPVLGWLFKSKTSTIDKINLLFFLTPQILSPYESTAGPLLKDSINRRAAHLKNVHGEDDPFKVTAKALFKKGQDQMERPLYDQIEGGRFYQEENLKSGIVPSKESSSNIRKQRGQPEVPNYRGIHQDAKRENVKGGETEKAQNENRNRNGNGNGNEAAPPDFPEESNEVPENFSEEG